MRRLFLWALSLLICALLLLPGCEKRPEPVEFTTFAMDTVMNFTLYGDEEECAAARSMIGMALSDYEASLSATREGSDVDRVNRANGQPVELSCPELLVWALELCALTGGALDITSYPAVKAWGFTTGEHRVPSDGELEELAAKIDYTAVELGLESQSVPTGSDGEPDWSGSVKQDTVTLPAGMELDLGAVAKGYVGDVLAGQIGLTSALLDLGQSTILAVGAKPDGKPWRIGVVDPAQPGRYFAVVELEDMAMGASGGYQRYFEEDGVVYWHILDPDTAAPARSGLSSVTVISPSALLCDGLSTALFVMGLEEGAQFWRDHPELAFEAVFVTEAGEVFRTAGLEGRFSLAEGYEELEVTVLE